MSASSLDFTGFTIKIARYDAEYPIDTPDSYVVGFNVTCNANGRSMYLDTRVYYADAAGKTEQEVAQQAWAALAPQFAGFVSAVSVQPAILGSVFTP